MDYKVETKTEDVVEVGAKAGGEVVVEVRAEAKMTY